MSDRFRVILVGRTGLDAHLRLDPAVELVRVTATLDAIGELAEPMDAPQRSVVIVAEAAEPAEEAARRTFVDALRSGDPAVRILRASAEQSSANGVYAGAVSARDGATAVRAALEPATHSFAQKLLHAPQPDQAEAQGFDDETLQADAAGVMDTVLSRPPVSEGDGPVVRRLLEGRDVLPAAIDLARARASIDAIRFQPEDHDNDSSDDNAVRIPVETRGQRFGDLVAPQGSDARALSDQAEWIASWLRLEELHAELRTAAFTDPLTGAWNRRYFERFLDAAIRESTEHRHDLTLMVFDVDDFKSFNDNHGHGTGDNILIEVVRLLRATIRPTDRVCRIGGDEFAVIFHDPDGPREPTSSHPRDVYDIAARFQKHVCTHQFEALGINLPDSLTISGGLATFPWDGRTSKQLLERADQLALESKRTGKNAITLGPAAAKVCGTEHFGRDD